MHNDLQALRRILKTCPTIAVVGLSAEWHRPSYFAAKYMQSQGFRIVPVNPRYAGTPVLGETCYASLNDIPFKVDMVDVFRRTEDVLPIAGQAVQIGARCLWQQLGVATPKPWPSTPGKSLTRPPAHAPCRFTKPAASCLTAPSTPHRCSTCRPLAMCIRA